MCNRYRNDIRKAGRQMEMFGFEEFSETKIVPRFDNLPADIYPNYLALVGVLNDGKLLPESKTWGFPKVEGKYVTNVRFPEKTFWKGWMKPEWRCVVPATAFAEFSYVPPKGDRFFELSNEQPFCFAGIWRPWEGDRGTKKTPNVGKHEIFAFLTTEPNGVVKPFHEKAMPAILRSREEVLQWLTAPVEDALKLQRPLPDDELRLAA